MANLNQVMVGLQILIKAATKEDPNIQFEFDFLVGPEVDNDKLNGDDRQTLLACNWEISLDNGRWSFQG